MLQVDASFKFSYLLQLILHRLTSLCKHLPHIVVNRPFDILAQLYYQLGVPPAFFYVFTQRSSNAPLSNQLYFFMHHHEVDLDAFDLLLPLKGVALCLNDLVLLGFLEQYLLLLIFIRVEEVYFGLFYFTNDTWSPSYPTGVWAESGLRFIRHQMLLVALCVYGYAIELLGTM